MGREKLRDNWIVGFQVVKIGDSTCHPRDSKEGYLYCTILGFTKQFSGVRKRLETRFVKMNKQANKQDSTIGDPPPMLLRHLLLLFVIT